MKQTIIALSLICCQLGLAQTITKHKLTKDNESIDNHIYGEKISYVSLKKDTLILPDDKLGKLICSTWDKTPKNKKPVILFADMVTINKKNEVFYASRKKNYTKN